MKTLEEITQESARAVLDYYAVGIDEDIVDNEPVNILAWELADHAEAIKKYLRENTLPDVTKVAFLADLDDIRGMVK